MEIENGLKDGIIATDRRGRRRVSAERRAAVLAELARSGMTGAAFARWTGMKYATLATWRQGERRRAAKEAVARKEVAPSVAVTEPVEIKPAPLQWVQAVPAPERPPSIPPEVPALIVHAAGGVKLELRSESHVAWASKLLAQLEGPRRC